jgi:hypothetical protein
MKTKSTKRSPVCENTDINATEFQVYYSCDADGEWQHDETFKTLAKAEKYCRQQSKAYAAEGDDPWEFYIYETKCVRIFRGRTNHELILEEQ